MLSAVTPPERRDAVLGAWVGSVASAPHDRSPIVTISRTPWVPGGAATEADPPLTDEPIGVSGYPGEGTQR
jgi:hypothetical protein